MDKMREEFEGWIGSQQGVVYEGMLSFAWAAWQAARAQHVDAIDTLSERVEKHCENRHDCQPAGEAVAEVESDGFIKILNHNALYYGVKLYTAPPAQVPDGWQLVPGELTPEMRYAWDAAPNGEDDDRNMRNGYRSMLYAAPQPTQQPAQVPDASSYAKLHAAATAAVKYANEFNLGDYQGRFDELRTILAARAQPASEEVVDGAPKNYKKLAEWLEHENAVLRHRLADPPAQVPDGWQLVPVELTTEMRDAWDAAPNGEDDDRNMRDGYRAMLAAAPQPMQQPAQVPELSQAAQDVLAERRRQVEEEGWTPEHDDKHNGCEMAAAAATYALCTEPEQLKVCGVTAWPWHAGWWKPSTYRRNLIKAGALILAEIERIDRSAAPQSKE